MFNSIMVVCVGNICRSPIAEALLKNKKPQLKIFSSGIGALVGKPADPLSKEVLLEKNGISLDNHRAQQINSVLVSASDLILAMEQKHIDVIHSKYPEARGKVHLIGKWDNNTEIPDPYRKDKQTFEHVLDLIESGVNSWQDKL